MSLETSALLDRLASVADSVAVRRLRSVLSDAEARVRPPSTYAVLAADIEPIWRVRQQNAKSQNRRFLGLSSLLTQLRKSSPDRQIEICHAMNEVESGTMFFDALTKEFLGVVMVTMSEHTKAYYRGELTGRPFDAPLTARKPSRATTRHTAGSTRVVMSGQ
jgi:hypothetical protein